MNTVNSKTKIQNEKLVISSIRKCMEAELKARKAGEPGLAFFISLAVEQAKIILNKSRT